VQASWGKDADDSDDAEADELVSAAAEEAEKRKRDFFDDSLPELAVDADDSFTKMNLSRPLMKVRRVPLCTREERITNDLYP
jgi:hypothetical protein